MRQTIACTLAALFHSCAAEAQSTRPVPEPVSPAAARPDAPVMGEAQARPGLPVVRARRGDKTLQQAGAVFGDNLSPRKARILLMLALQTTADPKQIQQLFGR